MRRIRSVVMISLLIMGVQISTPQTVVAEGAAPTWTVGDYWLYTGQGIIFNQSFTALFRLEMKGLVTIKAGNTTSGAYWCNMTISINFGGTPATIHGDYYFRNPDLATIKTHFTFGTTENTVTYDPPLQNFQFPLSNDQSWSSISLENVTIDGASTLRTVTVDHAVKGPQSITVLAGTFDVYTINSTERSGQPLGELPYSDKVGFGLNFIASGAELPFPIELQLKSYKYQKSSQEDSLTMPLITVLIAVVVIVILLILILRRRGKKTTTEVDDGPIYGESANKRSPYKPPPPS